MSPYQGWTLHYPKAGRGVPLGAPETDPSSMFAKHGESEATAQPMVALAIGGGWLVTPGVVHGPHGGSKQGWLVDPTFVRVLLFILVKKWNAD